MPLHQKHTSLDKRSRMMKERMEQRSTIRERLEDERTQLQSELARLKKQTRDLSGLVDEIDELLGDKA